MLRARSDLQVRVLSAVVMAAVAGAAFWIGGWVADALVLAIVVGVAAEWTQLVQAFETGAGGRAVWLLAGAMYLGVAAYSAVVVLASHSSVLPLVRVIAIVIGVDIGAYFAGRRFGGPKIAPSISPSKTWSGLAGGVIGAAAVFLLLAQFRRPGNPVPAEAMGALALALGALTAIVAQSGDFFESWMKRRAGVKDSGRLIPGHGGLFDRADGLIAVLFVIGVFSMVTGMTGR